MTDTSETAPPWWEAFKEGQRVSLAFVKIDRTGSTEESATLPADIVARRYRDYTAGVEWIARTYGAAWPLHWAGDGVMLFFTDVAGPTLVLAPVQAFRAARALWQRVALESNLTARIAVHAGFVQWQPDTGKLRDDTLNMCGHLESTTPPNGVALTEDIYLLLSPEEQKDCAPLGITKRDGIPAYVYPATMAAKRDSAKFLDGHDHALWDAFRHYALSSEISLLRYVGFRLTKKQPPALDIRDVFVPSTVQMTERKRMNWRPERRARDVKGAARRQKLAEERDEIPFAHPDADGEFTREASLEDVLRQNRALVVLGDPGSGKTTLLRWLAVAAARGAYGLGLDLGIAERLLPLPVSVGRLAEIRRELGSTAPVIECLARYYHARNLGAPDALKGFLEARMKAGECLLLLDGLDEVQSAERESIHTWLETFASQYTGNRWVVSSRVVGYRGFALSGGKEIFLRSFSDEQVEKYIGAFCQAYVRWENNGVADPAAGARAAAQLSESLTVNPRLKALVRNPFLLSGLALIHRAEGRVPGHRVQFYDIFSRCLCEAWGTARRIVAESVGKASGELSYEGEALPILGALACKMHKDHPSGRAPREYVILVLATVLQKKRSVPLDEARQAAEEFLKRAADGVQIFLERGPDEWGFLHLTFQEFFCAAGLHAEERFATEAFKHLFDPRWEEVIRLGVGYMAMVQNRPEEARRFVQKVRRFKYKQRPWVTNVLRLQVPLAALLAAEAEDAVPPTEQRDVASELADWVLRGFPLSNMAMRILSEMALTEFNVPVAGSLIVALQDKEEIVRASAANALGQLKSDTAIQPLIAALQDKEASVRGCAADALGQLKNDTAIQPLIAAFQDKESYVRWSAAKALGQLKSDTAIQPLIAALQDKEASVRTSAADALGQLKSDAAIQPLIAALQDKEEIIRWSAAKVLGQLKGDAAIQPLLSALQDKEAFARECAADALGQLKSDIAIQPLIAALQDKEASVRTSAANALGQLKSDAAIQPLLSALQSKEAYIHWGAAEALVSISEVPPAPKKRQISARSVRKRSNMRKFK